VLLPEVHILTKRDVYVLIILITASNFLKLGSQVDKIEIDTNMKQE